jgi:putative membrane protein
MSILNRRSAAKWVANGGDFLAQRSHRGSMSVIKRYFTIVIVSAIVTACVNSKANDAGGGRTATAAEGGVSSADRTFVDNAVASGKTEVEHATLAESNATSQAVKDYATHLRTAHLAANDELLKILGSKGISLDDDSRGRDKRGSIGAKDDATTATKVGGRPTGSPNSTGTTGASGSVETTGEAIDRNRSSMTNPWMRAGGAAFDEGFLDAQIKMHQDAIALFNQHSSIGADPDLKAFAAKQLPELREHLRQAEDLRRTMRSNP